MTIDTKFIPNLRGRRPADLPQLTDGKGRPLPRYLVEKAIGLRRETGAAKLKRLTTRHLKMLGMRLEGYPLERIAQEMNCTLHTVSRVLNDPLAQDLLRKVYTSRASEVQHLAGKAIEATREALNKEQPIGVRLRGVAAFQKIHEVMVPKDTERETAEDVVQRILKSGIIAENVQINVGTKGG